MSDDPVRAIAMSELTALEMLIALRGKLIRFSRVDCDPANGSAISQARGRAEGDCADELRPIIEKLRAEESERSKGIDNLLCNHGDHLVECRNGVCPECESERKRGRK